MKSLDMNFWLWFLQNVLLQETDEKATVSSEVKRVKRIVKLKSISINCICQELDMNQEFARVSDCSNYFTDVLYPKSVS